MKWNEVTFETLYAAPSRNGIYKTSEFHGSGCRIVNMGELFGFDFISNQEMKRVELNNNELAVNSLEDGDLLFGRRSLVEAGAGKCSIVIEPPEPLTFESSIIRVRLDKQAVNPRYLYYYFRSPQGRGRIRSIVSGTNVKGIRGSDLKRLLVETPRKNVQDEIADVLSAYDEAIENNRQRMELLERAARLLYQEWFVRLRFPGHEHTKITKGIPQGWRVLPLNEFCPDLREAANPSELEADTPYIGLEHMPRRSITLNEWGRADEVTSTKLRFKSGDILFGKIRPYFHKVGFALTDGVSSSDSIVLRPVAEVFHGFSLLTVSSDWFVAVVSKTAKEGSKMPRADWNLMEKHQILVPPNTILVALQEIIAPTIEQLRTLAFTNQKLRTARDLLLPRLMSGEIAV